MGVLIVAGALPVTSTHASEPNPIQIENARPGTAAWRITRPAGSSRRCPGNGSCSAVLPEGEPAIEGYAWPTSAGRGEVVSFFVNTTEPTFTLAIYRLGWYGGDGGREMLRPLSLPIVVRGDSHPADILVQCSVTTWQAYNCWGGKSLYGFNSLACARANEVSFLRPYANGDGAGELFYFEINLIRWLEREGYRVSYCTNLDVHERPDFSAHHKAFISSGHDEYWSDGMRTHVEGARDAGIHLAFLTANACYWQIRLEPGALVDQPLTTVVCYKDQALTGDPLALAAEPGNDSLVTVRWKPECRLIGVEVGTVLPGLLGNEMDRWYPTAAPPGIEILAQSPVLPATFPDPHSHMSIYRVRGKETLVFATGTLQWSWGLDDYSGLFRQSPRVSEIARQMTRNLLARFLDPPGRVVAVEEHSVAELRAWPVPFTPGREPLRLSFTAGDEIPDRARVYDLAGRPVAELESSSARKELSWDGRDSKGVAVTPGIYWVTAGRQRTKVIVTR